MACYGIASTSYSGLRIAIVELPGVSSVEIEFQAKGEHRRLHIPQIAEAEMDALENHSGEEVDVYNLPRWPSCGFPLIVAKAKQLRYRDHSRQWGLADKNGDEPPFV